MVLFEALRSLAVQVAAPTVDQDVLLVLHRCLGGTSRVNLLCRHAQRGAPANILALLRQKLLLLLLLFLLMIDIGPVGARHTATFITVEDLSLAGGGQVR